MMTNNNDSFEVLSKKVEAAFQQVAKKVLAKAKQTGTPIIVWKDGRVQALPVSYFEEQESVSPPADPPTDEKPPVS